MVRVAPGRRTGLWVHLSLGAWEVAHHPRTRLEFFAISEEPSPSEVELLAMLAHYHLHERLGEGHTVPIGRPWRPGSKLDHLLLSLPYTFGPKLGELDLGEVEVHVLWALPITGEEKAFRHQHGLEALEERFEASGVAYWDAGRGSVV